MPLKTRFIPFLALLAAAELLQAAPDAASDDAFEEIQVTATRRAQSVSDVSAAITLIPADEIQSAKLTTDALAAQTGVFLQQSTPGQGAAILRGLKGSEVLHLVDGMRLNNAIFRNAPTQYLALVAPASIARIEIVRGAPTSLYGSDAVGGVVQALSREPQFGSSTTEWRGEAIAVFDLGELTKSIGATLETGNERLAGLLSASYADAGNRRTGSGERIGPSGFSSKSARAAVTITQQDNAWLFDFQYAAQPDTPRVDELVPGFGESEPASAEFRFAPNERQFAHVRYRRDDGLLSADWRIDAGWQRIVDDRVTRNFGSSVRRREFNRSDLFGLTFTASRDTGFGSWIAGAEVYRDEVRSRRSELDLTSGMSSDVQPRFPDGSTVIQAAVFTHFDFGLSDRQALAGGLRVSSVDVKAKAASVAASIEETDASGDLGWMYDVTDSLQVVANVAYGFRAPNVFDIGTLGERPGNRFNVPNADLRSERVTHFDLGLRVRGKQSELEIALFQLHYVDRISSVLTGGVTPDGRDIVQSRNQSSADIRGVEVGGSWRPQPHIYADLVLNYTWGEQSDGPADRIPPLNGRAGLRVHYEALSVAAAIVFADRQDRLSARDVRDIRIDPNGTAGWGVLNLRADWTATESLRASLRLDNLFDKRYRSHGSGLDAVGRNAAIELRYTW